MTNRNIGAEILSGIAEIQQFKKVRYNLVQKCFRLLLHLMLFAQIKDVTG